MAETDEQIGSWIAAGLYDPGAPTADDRLALLKWLQAEGLTLEEMVEAAARGRLFAAVGDRILRGRGRRLTIDDCADVAGMHRDRFVALWRALGFPDPAPGSLLLTEVEARTFSVVALAELVLGEARADRLSTTISRAMRTIAEATNTAFIEADDSTMLDRSGSELTTAQVDAMYDGMIPSFHQWLLVLHALHHESTNDHLELAFGLGDRGDEAIRLAVGFGDVTGYTSLSNRLSSGEFATLVGAFERWAADEVRQAGASLVKTLGDGLMFVGSIEAVARAALRLVQPRAAPAELRLHAGIAYGAVLATGGDYFGPVVNLAARLCGAAADGEVLADTPAASAWLGHGPATRSGSSALKGFDQPVELWRLRLE